MPDTLASISMHVFDQQLTMAIMDNGLIDNTQVFRMVVRALAGNSLSWSTFRNFEKQPPPRKGWKNPMRSGEVRQNQMEGIMIEVLPESHDNILGVKDIGKLTDLVYKTILIPQLEGMIRDYQKSPVPLPDAASVIKVFIVFHFIAPPLGQE
ncbi:MAG: hypothetical protein KIT39_17470 [Nitrospirales bacterium]|nr:hypothetical protein [Nitrospirales bacterium]